MLVLNRSFLRGFLCLLGTLASGAASAQAIDVLGVKTGMTLEQVKAALLKHDPAMRFTEGLRRYEARPNYPASIIELRASCYADRCPERLVVRFTQLTKKAYYIESASAAKLKVKVADYKSELARQFGIDVTETNQAFGIAFSADWHRDKGGAIIYSNRTCPVYEHTNERMPLNVDDSCHQSFKARVWNSPASNPEFATRIVFNVLDYAVVKEALAVLLPLQDAAKAAERARLDPRAGAPN
jgi:hypothetical protein